MSEQASKIARLRKIHGRGKCHICGKPKISEGASFCSYPHAMVPKGPADPEKPKGFWTWDRIADDR